MKNAKTLVEEINTYVANTKASYANYSSDETIEKICEKFLAPKIEEIIRVNKKWVNEIKPGTTVAGIILAPYRGVRRCNDDIYGPLKKTEIQYSKRSRNISETIDEEYLFSLSAFCKYLKSQYGYEIEEHDTSYMTYGEGINYGIELLLKIPKEN